MHFDCKSLETRAIYKLLVSTVVPRPIALVTTLSRSGHVNAAPFSFFNAVDYDPPTVVLGIETRPDGRLKDTAANIQDSREFVVNLVDEALSERMNVCAAPFEPHVSESHMAELAPVPSVDVGPPRLADAPAAMECKHLMTVEPTNGRHVVFGQVLHFHFRDDIIIDAERCYVDVARLSLIGRLNASFYCRTQDHFRMPRPRLDEWADTHHQGRPVLPTDG